MPAETAPDWIDDAAFYDEAWADLEQRLDARDRRPKAGWWWLPVGLGLAALVAGIALLATPSLPAPPPVASTKPPAGSYAGSYPLAEGYDLYYGGELPPPPGDEPLAGRNEKTPTQVAARPSRAPAPPPALAPAAPLAAGASPPPGAASGAPDVPPPTPKAAAAERALLPLPSAALTVLPRSAVVPSLPSPNALRRRGRFQFGLAAGGLFGPGAAAGASLGGWASLGGPRLQPWLGLRLRRDHYGFDVEDALLVQASDTELVAGGTDTVFSYEGLSTTAAELLLGFRSPIGSRWSVTGFAGLSRLFAGRLAGRFGGTSPLADAFDSTSRLNGLAALAANTRGENASVELLRLNPWQYRLGFDVAYRPAGRWSVYAGYEQRLSQLASSGEEPVGRIRLTAGVGYRLR